MFWRGDILPEKYEELLIEVEGFIMNVRGRVTSDPMEQEFNYNSERQKLLSNPLTKPFVPAFIKTCRTDNILWSYMKEKFASYAERRSFINNEFLPMIAHLEALQFNEVPIQIESLFEVGKEYEYIQTYWEKAKSKVELDPEGAITNARTLLESCLKYILDSLNVSYKDNGDLNVLYKAARTELKLAPEQYSEDNFVKILSGCASVVGGLAAIRNDLSDSHGKRIRHSKPTSRHARLVVNFAGAMSEFLIDTYLSKFAKRDDENVTV